MRLSPRYGDSPIVSIEVRSPPPHPILQQRRRLEATLRDLSQDEWVSPSRCHGWTAQDVVTHLVSTNAFWALSIQAGVGGEPTRFLGAFDPVASPAQLVDQAKDTPVAETLEQLIASTAALEAVVDGLGDADWDVLGEAPPGHVPIALVADHALWDCWVHERDIVLPLGRPAVVDDDEVLTCLRYAASLGPAFEIGRGRSEPGDVALEVRAPTGRIVVEIRADHVRVHDGPAPAGSATLDGDAVELLEMLSLRDVEAAVPALVGSLTAGLAVAFDRAAPSSSAAPVE